MKKFVGFYYRCSLKVCLCVFLSLIGLLLLSSSAFAEQYGDFTYTVSGGTVTITGFTSCQSELTPTGATEAVIPDTIDDMPVVGIGYRAFWYCTSLTSVTIPNSVTSIGDSAFEDCRGLTSMTIPDSVTSIGDDAFRNCWSLTSVNIPNSVTSIGHGLFAYCYRLTSVTIPNSVTSIRNFAFFYCSGLTSVTIPNSVTFIGDSAFLHCHSLTSVTIPNSVTNIWPFTFEDCWSLTSVTIPNSVTSIGGSAFEGCSRLTSVSIPNSVTRIEVGAFEYCTGLTKAYFLGNAPAMGSSVFNYCASNFSVCYTAGSTGFTTPTWYGYPASVCGGTTSSTTTSIVTSSTTTTTPPTVVSLIDFNATPGNRIVTLTWSTASQIDNAGFNLYRSESEDGEYIKINDALIPAQGFSTQGASYEFTDTDVKNRRTYYYKLEDIDLNGKSTMHGPVSATPRWFLGIFGIFKK